MHIPPTDYQYPKLYEELVESNYIQKPTDELVSILKTMSYDFVNVRKFYSEDQKEDCRIYALEMCLKYWWKYNVVTTKSPKSFFITIMKSSWAHLYVKTQKQNNTWNLKN